MDAQTLILGTAIFLTGTATLGHSATAPPSPVSAPFAIPRGVAVTVDGVASPAEWDDAVPLPVRNDLVTPTLVRVKHDGASLLALFEGLAGDSVERYPELLVDTGNERSTAWKPGIRWMHVSYSDCERDGEYFVYQREGSTPCAPTKAGWTGNNFPFDDSGTIEVEISLAHLGLASASGSRFGLALGTSDARKLTWLWPSSARIADPSTWSEVVLSPEPATPESRAHVADPLHDNAEARATWKVPEPARPAEALDTALASAPVLVVTNGAEHPLRVSCSFGPWRTLQPGATTLVSVTPGMTWLLVTDEKGKELLRRAMLMTDETVVLVLAPKT